MEIGRIQWVVALGLFPLSIGLFHQFSLVSFVANSIAIPWVAFIIVPLTLLGSIFLFVSTKIGGLFLLFADKNLSYLWILLTYLSHLNCAVWYQFIPSNELIFLACIGIVLLLLPRGLPGRWLGITWLLPIILYQAPKPNLGEMNFTLLDVGQGLSAVIQTHDHILVFDAGAKLSDSFDMGKNVVVPFLQSLSIKNIDMLVISHGDNDHIGGASAIRKAFQVKSVKTSVPEYFPQHIADYCIRNQSWEWDGVKFSFLYPTMENLGLNNDSSCVLKVVAGQNSVLLTGDIEKLAEKYLVENEFINLKSDILVAPHHGSKTSANQDFINAVHPAYVLFPVGYRNRYHFPHDSVVELYKQSNVIQKDTVNLGAINFHFLINEVNTKPQSFRLTNNHFWNYISR